MALICVLWSIGVLRSLSWFSLTINDFNIFFKKKTFRKVKKDGSFKTKSPDDLDHVEESDNAIRATGLPREILIERRAGTSFISHNKFMILIRADKPVSVWTGA